MCRLFQADRKVKAIQARRALNAQHTTKQMDYGGRRPHRVLLRSTKNGKLKPQFTQAHETLTTEDWKNVVVVSCTRCVHGTQMTTFWDVVQVGDLDHGPNQQQLRDAIMSTWFNISCLQHLVESLL